MKVGLLILLFLIAEKGHTQRTIWQDNKIFVDSLITMYRTQSGCSLTGSTLKHISKKRRIDLRLIEFLNKFYYGEFDKIQIEALLQAEFRQTPWRFDEKASLDSFNIYKGRLRSYGNLEPFITYVTVKNKIIGTHITIRIRSSVDCLQPHDQAIPDLEYLSNLIPERVTFPFEVKGWSEYFESRIWLMNSLSEDLKQRVRDLIGPSSAVPLKLAASHNMALSAISAAE